jgi:hypothetical protein
MNNNNPTNRNTNIFSFILKYFGLFMVIVYLTLGILIIFHKYLNVLPDNLIFPLSNNERLLIGSTLIVYGIFRAYRVIKN